MRGWRFFPIHILPSGSTAQAYVCADWAQVPPYCRTAAPARFAGAGDAGMKGAASHGPTWESLSSGFGPPVPGGCSGKQGVGLVRLVLVGIIPAETPWAAHTLTVWHTSPTLVLALRLELAPSETIHPVGD